MQYLCYETEAGVRFQKYNASRKKESLPRRARTCTSNAYKRKLNHKQAARRLSSLMLALFGNIGGWLVTLTFLPGTEWEYAEKQMAVFLDRLRYLYERDGLVFRYACVMGCGKGQLHYHLVISTNGYGWDECWKFFNQEWQLTMRESAGFVSRKRLYGNTFAKLARYFIKNAEEVQEKYQLSRLPRVRATRAKIAVRTVNMGDGDALPPNMIIADEDAEGGFTAVFPGVEERRREAFRRAQEKKPQYFEKEVMRATRKNYHLKEEWNKSLFQKRLENDKNGEELLHISSRVLGKHLLDPVQQLYVRKGRELQRHTFWRLSEETLKKMTDFIVAGMQAEDIKEKDRIKQQKTNAPRRVRARFVIYKSKECSTTYIEEGKIVGGYFFPDCMPGVRKRINARSFSIVKECGEAYRGNGVADS